MRKFAPFRIVGMLTVCLGLVLWTGCEIVSGNFMKGWGSHAHIGPEFPGKDPAYEWVKISVRHDPLLGYSLRGVFVGNSTKKGRMGGPDMSTAVVISSDRVLYPLRLASEGTLGGKQQPEGHDGEFSWGNSYFVIMDPRSPNRNLDNLPSGSYAFTITMVGPAGRMSMGGKFKWEAD
jgi:hypothetical protein